MAAILQPHVQIFADPKAVICAGRQCRASVNPVAAELYETALQVYEFFSKNFGIAGVNGEGEVPPFYIGWDQKNAAWTCQSNGQDCILRFADELALRSEVVAHEYTHGILNRLTHLGHFGMAGALHESISDAMGVAFKHTVQDVVDWQIGNFRDLSVHKDMKAFKTPTAQSPDNGYVHDNSRIPSHAFFQAVMELKGKSYGVMAQIWMGAAFQTTSDESFKSFALKTLVQAQNFSPKTARAVGESWIHVGVLVIQVPRNPAQTRGPQALRFQSIHSTR